MDYQKGKIYKIESHLGDKIYVGSTTKKYLSERMTAHRGDYSKWKKGTRGNVKSFELFEEYGLENCNIVLLELCPCNSKDELNAKEAHYIKTLKCVNKKIPGRTKKEWTEENQEKIKFMRLKNNEKNKDKISKRQKEYDEKRKDYLIQPFKCECGCTVQLREKLNHQRSKKHIELMKNKTN